MPSYVIDDTERYDGMMQEKAKAYAESTLLLFAGGRPSLFTNRICFGVGRVAALADISSDRCCVDVVVVALLCAVPCATPVAVCDCVRVPIAVPLDLGLMLHLESLGPSLDYYEQMGWGIADWHLTD